MNNVITYICNRKRCKKCMNSCYLTTDINYASNFVKVKDNYYEEINDEKKYRQGFRDGLLASGKQL